MALTETQRESQRRWRQANPEKCALYSKRYHSKEPERWKKHAHEYYLRNKEKYAIRSRLWALEHPKEMLEIQQRFMENSPDRIRKIRNKYLTKRRKVDLAFRIECRLRGRLQKALARLSAKKLSHFNEIIGCSIQFLMGHLEAKFKPGMSWENYGPVWHIDHILPCASFDLTSEAQQRACFHYQNLQPLFAQENYDKGAKIITS